MHLGTSIFYIPLKLLEDNLLLSFKIMKQKNTSLTDTVTQYFMLYLVFTG